MSQRDIGFNGGIQTGTTAASFESCHLEKIVSSYIQNNYSICFPYFWDKGMSGEEICRKLDIRNPAPIAGVYPDGGIFFNRYDEPILAFECKKQGKNGNAIERWYKNAAILTILGVKRYVTFCEGEGFFNNNSAERILAGAIYLESPEKNNIWEDNADSIFRCYRFKTIQEAEEMVPKLIDKNIHEVL